MLFKNIEKISGTNEKITYIKEEIKSRPFIKESLIYAVNRDKYNLSKRTLLKFTTPSFSEVEMSAVEWNTIKRLLDKLRDREITKQEEIVREINALYFSISEEGYEWFNRICKKDLTIGILSKNLNKALGEKEIKGFEIMLADSGIDNISFGECYVEPKLDGVRALVYVVEDELIVMSRGGKRYGAYEEIIEKKLSEENKKTLSKYAIDSEIINGNSFRKTSGAGHSKHKDRDEMQIIVNAFDIIDLSILLSEEDTYKVTLVERKKVLSKELKNFDSSIFKLNPFEIIKVDKEVLEKKMKDLVKEGFEGVMVKDINGYYEKKRSKSWIKIKPTYTVEVRILAAEEGKNKGELGAFVVGFDNSDTTSRVGSGFEKNQRKDFWINREKMIGIIIEVEFQEIQDTLRFPRFIKIRDDKSITDEWKKVITWNPNWKVKV